MKYFLLSLLVIIGIVSCQKEIGLDEGINIDSVAAVFSLQGSPDSCTSAISRGYYAAATALTDSNTVSISVNVTTPGTYVIATDTVNGYRFFDSGFFVVPGVQTVVLKGSGTPLLVKTDTFTPRSTLSGAIGCSFKIKVVLPTPAVYTLTGAPDTCTIATVGGVYGLNVPLAASNTVTVQVNVTAIGSYNIATDTVAGVSFSKSGIFSSTGIMTVALEGNGTPTSAGTKAFKIGSGGCIFTVPILGPAVYTTSGAPGACTVATVGGIYTTLSPLSASNIVTVQVNVTAIGSYTIYTDTVGGMSFQKTGIFTTTGIQTVVLDGNGQPTVAGSNTFKIKPNGCTFKVIAYGPAAYTLSGAPGTCTVATVSGTYTSGIALTAADSVTVQVNVTTIGAYTISTDTVGGIWFSAMGIFTTTGLKTIILKGNGTPTISGTNTFTVGSGGCKFNITVAAPIGVYSCKVDGVFISFIDRAEADTSDNSNSPATPYLYLDGYSGPPNGGNVPELQIFITKNNGSAITAGTYNVDGVTLPDGYRIEIDYHVVNSDSSVTIWNTSSTLLTPNPPFTITVTSISATKVTGTFSGKLTNIFDGSTQTKTVTEGVFDLPIN